MIDINLVVILLILFIVTWIHGVMVGTLICLHKSKKLPKGIKIKEKDDTNDISTK